MFFKLSKEDSVSLFKLPCLHLNLHKLPCLAPLLIPTPNINPLLIPHFSDQVILSDRLVTVSVVGNSSALTRNLSRSSRSEMGNRYQKNHQHWSDSSSHKGIFLPMLCSRPSVKSVAVPESFSDEADPLSPKVGCMGQVKKRNGRVVGFSTPYKLPNHGNIGAAIKANNIVISCSSNAKYTKLRKLFSSRSLTGTATNSPSSAATTTTTVARRQSVSKSGPFGSKVENSKEVVNIGEMDPPLPVVKKVRKPDEEGGSLWLRRFGGVAPHLRSLEIQHSNPRHQLQLVTV